PPLSNYHPIARTFPRPPFRTAQLPPMEGATAVPQATGLIRQPGLQRTTPPNDVYAHTESRQPTATWETGTYCSHWNLANLVLPSLRFGWSRAHPSQAE